MHGCAAHFKECCITIGLLGEAGWKSWVHSSNSTSSNHNNNNVAGLQTCGAYTYTSSYNT